MNKDEKKATVPAHEDLWDDGKETIWSSKTPTQLLKGFFAIIGGFFVLAIVSYFLFGNVEIGKLSFGHNELFGYFIRYDP
ncbi:Uncharacterised protein [Serratia entomophila]|uniref:hypothetical protein n=1 Tax=Serratia entomophila TaxID=42906 RepID=UPI00217909BB|nr:hypothetical protein [Serratia entomophila]CAI1002224.1 Uncharacterised protein [Serratia entomophila]